MQEQGWGTGTHRGYYAKNSVNSLDLLVFFSYQPVIPINVPQKLFYLQKKKFLTEEQIYQNILTYSLNALNIEKLTLKIYFTISNFVWVSAGEYRCLCRPEEGVGLFRAA